MFVKVLKVGKGERCENYPLSYITIKNSYKTKGANGVGRWQCNFLL